MSGLEFFKAAFSSGQTVYVRARVVPAAGARSFDFVERVWRRDGVEVAHRYIPINCGTPNGFRTSREERGKAEPSLAHAPVGDEHGWQTWSRHRVEAGDYTVDVVTPDGRRLAAKTFTVL